MEGSVVECPIPSVYRERCQRRGNVTGMEHDRQSIDAVRKRGGFDSGLDPHILSLDRAEQERLARGFRDAGAAMESSADAAEGNPSERGAVPGKEAEGQPLGLWDRFVLFFLQLFTGITTEEFLKNRELAHLAAHVRTFRPPLYNFRSNQLLGAFGETVYKLSTIMTGMRQLFEACRFTGPEGGGKGFAEYFVRRMMPALPDLDSRYSQEYIRINRNLFGEKQIKATVERDVEQAAQGIGYEQRSEINSLYANFVAFQRLAFFNYYALLRRFGENYAPGRGGFPEFSAAEGNDALFDLTRLEELLYSVDLSINMDSVFSALSGFADLLAGDGGGSASERPFWTEDDAARLRAAIMALLQDDRLVSIVRLITRNPKRLPAVRRIPVNPVEEMKALQRARLVPRIQATLHQLEADELGKRISELFGTIELPEFEFYNETTNRRLQAMELPLFLHCRQVQIAKAFQQTMFDTMIRPALNSIVMDGEFLDKGMQAALGDFFYRFNEVCGQVFEFERKVSLSTPEGDKVQNLILRFSGDPPTRKVVTDKIHFLNNMAAKSLRDLAVLVVQAVRPLSAIVRDGGGQNKPEFVRNIRMVGGARNKLVIKAVQRVLEVTNALAGILEPFAKEN